MWGQWSRQGRGRCPQSGGNKASGERRAGAARAGGAPRPPGAGGSRRAWPASGGRSALPRRRLVGAPVRARARRQPWPVQRRHHRSGGVRPARRTLTRLSEKRCAWEEAGPVPFRLKPTVARVSASPMNSCVGHHESKESLGPTKTERDLPCLKVSAFS